MFRFLFQIVLAITIWMGTGFETQAQSFPIALKYEQLRQVKPQEAIAFDKYLEKIKTRQAVIRTYVPTLVMAEVLYLSALRYHQFIGMNCVRHTVHSSQILPIMLSSVLPG